MMVHLTYRSKNRKTGPIPVSTTDAESCPPTCPHLGTDCYARFGKLFMHWRSVSLGKRGGNWLPFCAAVARFAAGVVWRHNQAGDLPKNKRGLLHKTMCMMLAKAAKHTRGFAYTHHSPRNPHNAAVIREMNAMGGLVVNLSADSPAEADEYHALGIGPVVLTLPEDTPHRGNVTPGGLPIVVCPAQTTDHVQCKHCPLCRTVNRKSVIGFLAHGQAKQRLSRKLRAAQTQGA